MRDAPSLNVETRCHPRLAKGGGLLGVGSKMEIGKQHLMGPEARALFELRLLDLDDEFGLGEDLSPVRC
jgi:hypothetical protein